MAGLRSENNMLQPLPMVTKIIPKNQARTVFAGTSGSSVRTAAATSGYGEFSSSSASMLRSASTSWVARAPSTAMRFSSIVHVRADPLTRAGEKAVLQTIHALDNHRVRSRGLGSQ